MQSFTSIFSQRPLKWLPKHCPWTVQRHTRYADNLSTCVDVRSENDKTNIVFRQSLFLRFKVSMTFLMLSHSYLSSLLNLLLDSTNQLHIVRDDPKPKCECLELFISPVTLEARRNECTGRLHANFRWRFKLIEVVPVPHAALLRSTFPPTKTCNQNI
jgi:hypothetical protein